jgi:tetratricopeptide (TPR) repeat protein
MRYLPLIALILHVGYCKPASESVYERSFALRAARDLDSAGNTVFARYYLQRARLESAAQAEVENFNRRIEERRLRTDDCVEAKKTDLAINQYPRIRHKHLFQMGICLEEAGDTRRALKFYEMAERANSAQPQLYIRRALLNFKTGNTAAASSDFERAVALNPKYPPALLNLALHHITNGKNAAAEALLAQLQSVRPNYAEIIADALQHQKEIIEFFRRGHG